MGISSSTARVKNAKRSGVVVVAVEVGTLEVIFVVDEIMHDAAVFVAEQTGVLAAPRHGYVDVADELKVLAEVLAHALVKRRHHRHARVAAHRVHRHGQRAGDLAQTARLGKRIDLCGYVEHARRDALFSCGAGFAVAPVFFLFSVAAVAVLVFAIYR